MQQLTRYFLYGTLFITGGVILVIEIAGSRVVAPFYGSSIFVWSSLITVTLASLAIGYALGGALADRKPQYTVLYIPIFIAGIFTMLIPKLASWALTATRGLGITYGPLVSAVLLFVIPLLFLAMMTPAAIRIQSKMLQQVGATAGRLYAVSTVGSLAGALVVGFVLIPFVGVSRIMTGSGVVLIVTALLWALSLRHLRAALVIAIISIIFFLIPDARLSAASDAVLLHTTPSFYGEIRVVQKADMRFLLVDGISQTIISTGPRPFPIYTETMRLAELLSGDPKRALVVGLGGGLIPMDLHAAGVATDIVEIEPKMVAVAEKYFNFQPGLFNIFFEDGRFFIQQTDRTYDIIVLDAYGAEQLPEHLLTRESFRAFKDHLSPGGILALNIIGAVPSPFIKSMQRTLDELFLDSLVLAESVTNWTNVLFFMSDDLPDDVQTAIAARCDTDECVGHYWNVLRNEQVRIEVDDTALVLTDEHTPVYYWQAAASRDFRRWVWEYLGPKVLLE